MKKMYIFLLINLFLLSALSGQELKPYILAGSVENTNMKELTKEVKTRLKNNGFEILGTYNPMQKKSRVLIAVTHPTLVGAVQEKGAFTGFALAMRVGLTQNGNSIDISYTNPDYWTAAYFQKSYDKIQNRVKTINKSFKSVFTSYGQGKQFGSKKGITAKKLQKYHYMMGMPYFEDNVTLGKFNSYKEAVNHIDAAFAKNPDLIKVYEKSLPFKKIKLYGVGIKGSEGEAKFMPVIDISNPKHTAFLPYELLVYENKAYMLHGRYRIALSFPDLTMGTFMKIVSTPGSIEDNLKKLCN